jgi:hypothetical protein
MGGRCAGPALCAREWVYRLWRPERAARRGGGVRRALTYGPRGRAGAFLAATA